MSDASSSDDEILQGSPLGNQIPLRWRDLTRLPEKVCLYRQETYFREGLHDAQALLGSALAIRLHQTALLIVKPEGLVAGKARPIMDFVKSHGFRVIGFLELSLTRLQWRELWRYQLSAATVDRITVNDLIVRGKVLLILLQHPTLLDVPASVWLSAQKGPSDKALQPKHCLRKLLGQPNRLFSYIHTSDEPADILREMGILLDSSIRQQFLARLLRGATPAEHELLERTVEASGQSARTFDAAEAVSRLQQATTRAGGGADEPLRAYIEKMRRGEQISWMPFAHAVADSGLEIDRWDLALLGATYISYDEPGMSKMIASAGMERWTQD